jgi:hypothetical protein
LPGCNFRNQSREGRGNVNSISSQDRRIVTAAALCAALPGAALADPGAQPNPNAKECKSLPSQAKAKGPKKAHQGKGRSAGKGKRCGFTHVFANGV